MRKICRWGNPIPRYTFGQEAEMGVIEDTRQLMQDFLAPELRELSARVDAVEKGMIAFEKRVDARFNAAETLAAERHGQVMQAIAQLGDIYELRERVTRIEARERAS
jgi:hypothetical protein